MSPEGVVPLRWDGVALELLDQRRLPFAETWVRCSSVDQVTVAIRDMVVRGAPAIGIAAAFGVVLAWDHADNAQGFAASIQRLRNARPTAVNLMWAVDQMAAVQVQSADRSKSGVRKALALHAQGIWDRDVKGNRQMGKLGAALLPRPARVLTHCNAGALATGGYGTALGVVRAAWSAGILEYVHADETRPYLQGARLTAWELRKDGIPVWLQADVAAASLMARGRVNVVIVGADRIVANGDVANKVGTLGLAVLAKHYGIPFLVAAPWSTVDMNMATGQSIEIEERPADEVRSALGQPTAEPDQAVVNPSFDVTPAALVSAIVTERGVVSGDLAEGLAVIQSSEFSEICA